MRLGDYCSKIGSGATPRGGREAYLSEGPFALIRSQNVRNDGFSRVGLAYIDEQQAAGLQNVAIQPGDVLLNITGDSVARACQVENSILPARVNQHVCIIRTISEYIDQRFLRYWLISPDVQSRLLGLASSGATRNALTKAMIEDLKVPELAIEQQQAIAAVLGSLDDKIGLNQRMNETLEAMARAIFKSWFIDFDPVLAKMEGRDTGLVCEVADLFPERFNAEGLPEGWDRTELGSQFDLSPRTPLSEGDELPYVEMAALPTNAARVTTVAKRSPTSGARFTNGDALLARITPCLENGKAAYVDFLEHDQVGIGSTEFIVFRPKERLSGIWAYLLMRNDDFRSHAIANMSGTSGRQRVSSDALAPWRISLPPMAVAGAFDATMAPIFLSLKTRDDESNTLAALRDLLLPKLMSGEARIKDAEKLVGEAGA